ncbi:hypothetical protein [Micromonospora globbae]|uniref:hypothetical protein n=1 Tax=Micromonospora globbae TaxID=1894969 RepID=UPI0011C457FA|nr:hypothetical protein [Micromonospora globbae]
MSDPTPTPIPTPAGAPTPEALDREAGHITTALDTGAQALGEYVGETSEADTAADFAGDAAAALDDAYDAVRSAVAKAREIAADINIYPTGRHAQINELMQRTAAKVAEAVKTATEAAEVAETVAVASATPEVDRRDALTARHDLDLVLGNVNDGTVSARLEALMATDSPAAHLAASDYLRLYLIAKGASPERIEALTLKARHEALKAAAASTDRSRQAAARAAMATTNARKAAAALQSALGMTRRHVDRVRKTIPAN